MKYQIAIIGGGPAGYTAAETAGKAGLSVVLFEKQSLGGVCLNEGCIPTKTLLYSAKTYDSARHASKYAVSVPEVSFDLSKIVARKKEWIRKQTLVNAERYITQELKEYEEKILGAEDKILILETQLYMELVQALSEFIPAIQVNANQIARLDCLLSFANVARENNYIRPVIEDNDVLDIRQGRHPVIEKQLPIGEKFIANDVVLDSSSQQIIIITGPNMAVQRWVLD